MTSMPRSHTVARDRAVEVVGTSTRYRRDIDGLRAVAVLSVVLFHAGVRRFSGGYVGVDVFFVISGYLITSLIAEEIGQQRFSIISFYERRVRRIFPALLAVMAVSSLLAIWLLLPPQFNNFAKAVFATAGFGSNMLFWREAGYFAAPATEQPLLHTWSLAVEEQFYVVFPLVLFGIYRILNGRWTRLLAPITALSFLLSVWGVNHYRSATFYLAPTRAWELLLGSLLALGSFPQVQNRLFMEALSIAGLGLIAWGVLALSTDSPFPGFNALWPCLGAALIIYSGQNTSTRITKILGTWPLVFVGLISYSLYLWHWPLLVFARTWNIYELNAAETALVVSVSILTAIVSWKFVEMPFRRRGGVFDRKTLFICAGGSTALLMAFALYGHFTRGWPGRVPSVATEIASYSDSVNPRQRECLNSPGHRIPVSKTCTYGADVSPSYVVWGDSHADALVDAIGKIAKNHDKAVKYLGSSSCAPVVAIERVAREYSCVSDNAAFLNYILGNHELESVIMIGRYAVYVNGWTTDLGPAEKYSTESPYITDISRTVSDIEGRQALLQTQFEATVRALLDAGKRVVLVYPIPEVGYDVPAALAQMTLQGEDPASFTQPLSYYKQRQQFIFRVLDSLGQSKNIIRIYPHRLLCSETACVTYAYGKPLYRDGDHLSMAGADFVAPLLDSVFGNSSSASSRGTVPDGASIARRF
jgi:peptidoglycan/LPS O-acetylase OafA/YrhL